MIHEVGVIFTHFNTNPVTLQNLDSIRHCNPDVPIIAVSSSPEHILPGGLDISRDKTWAAVTRGSAHQKWRNNDLKFYYGYRNRRVDCKRWVVLEWDAYCSMPLQEFFAESWDADIACRRFFSPGEEYRWYWFRERDRLPQKFRASAQGAVPLVAVLFSNEAMHRLSEAARELEKNIFCELRVGTLAKYLGLRCAGIPKADSLRSIRWKSVPVKLLTRPGIWHAVKRLI